MAVTALKDPGYYWARAVACERAAEASIDPKRRRIMLNMAHRWHALVVEAGGGLPGEPPTSLSLSKQERDYGNGGRTTC
jgi:hypothetical protein